MKIFYSYLGAMLLVCSSCTHDEPIVTTGEIQKIVITVNEFKLENHARTTLLPTDNGATFKWAEKDTIGIFPEKGDQLPFSMSSGAGTNVATITGGSWGLKTSEDYAAYYPFSRNNYFTDRANIYFSYVGQKQTGDNSTAHLGQFDLMTADNVEAQEGYLNFNFSHQGCILKLYVTIPNAGTYSSLSLSAIEAAFAKKVKLDLTKTPALLTSVENAQSMTLALDGLTTKSNNQTAIFYLMCAPFDLTGKTFTLKLKAANGYVYSETITLSKAFVAQKMYNIRFEELTKESTPSIGIGGEFGVSEEEEEM